MKNCSLLQGLCNDKLQFVKVFVDDKFWYSGGLDGALGRILAPVGPTLSLSWPQKYPQQLSKSGPTLIPCWASFLDLFFAIWRPERLSGEASSPLLLSTPQLRLWGGGARHDAMTVVYFFQSLRAFCRPKVFGAGSWLRSC